MSAFWPMLNTPTTSYSVQVGCGYLDPRYLAAEKSQHPAIDLNAVTGNDTDLGDPIHAADDGVVLGTMYHWNRRRTGGIGGIVQIRHADGSESCYWHCRDIHVVKGQTVRGGDLIGQVGKGAGDGFKAHLHFEVRRGHLPMDHWPSTLHPDPKAAAAYIREHYHDPLEWLRARGAKRTLTDLQAQRGEPTRVLIVRGDEVEDVTGKLVPLPANAVSLDARTATVRLYANDPTPASIPALPQK